MKYFIPYKEKNLADCVILAYALIEEINQSTGFDQHPNVVKDLFERSIQLSRELDAHIKSVMRDPQLQTEAANLLTLQSRMIRKISQLNRGWRIGLGDKRISA